MAGGGRRRAWQSLCAAGWPAEQSRATLNQKWRGSFALLRAVVDLSVQLEALQERMRGPRYDVVGPWPVCPSDIAEVYHNTL